MQYKYLNTTDMCHRTNSKNQELVNLISIGMDVPILSSFTYTGYCSIVQIWLSYLVFVNHKASSTGIWSTSGASKSTWTNCIRLDTFYFYGILFCSLCDTDIELTKEKKINIDTSEDLNRSNLHSSRKVIQIILSFENESIVTAFRNKSLILSKADQCVGMLGENKNFFCIFRESRALLAIHNHKYGNGSPLIKIVKEGLGFFVNSINFQTGTPYLQALDK